MTGFLIAAAGVDSLDTTRVAHTDDAVTWTLDTDPNLNGNGYAVAYSPTLNLWVAACDDNYLISDGTTWTSIPGPFPGSFSQSDVVWCDSLGLFVAGGISAGFSSPLISTSPDGLTWTGQVTPWDSSGGQVNGVGWSHTLGQVLALGESFDLAGHVMMRSTDGVTWTNVTTPLQGNVMARAAWSPSLGLWAAVGDPSAAPGAGAAIFSSPDGVTWTTRYTAPGTPEDVCWSPDLGLFVMADVASGSKSRMSSDGITWSAMSAAPFPTAGCTGVTWSPSLGLFVAVSVNSTSFYTSPDGDTWTNGGNIHFKGSRLLARA